MLDRIVNILKSCSDVSAWKLTQVETEANELFLIKKSIDMPRSKKINNITITVYKDFEEQGTSYRGSSTVSIHPTMKDEEIAAVIKEAVFAAGFVKNIHYPLPVPAETDFRNIESGFDKAPLNVWIPQIKDALYKHDSFRNGYINSTEVFLNRMKTTIMNSNGINYGYISYKGHIELITAWKEKGEEIELYKELMFSDYDGDAISQAALEMLEMSREKADTQPTPNFEGYTVILHGEPVAELLGYYYSQSNANAVYQQVSTAKLNESIQGENIIGDKITLSIDPHLKNSVGSAPIDEDGFVLNSHKVIDKGVLQKYWGNVQHCHYLNVEPTGRINNLIFEGGSKTIEEMRSQPHIEIAAFSDFMINAMTGDFAGEIRLGWHFDGKTRTAISGGSISGNITKQQTNMFLSKELQQCVAKDFAYNLTYKGPKALLMHNVAVAGN